MKKDSRFEQFDLDFWANTSLINQRLGYASKKLIGKFPGGFYIPDVAAIEKLYKSEGLDSHILINGGRFTSYGESIIDYFEYRADLLTNHIQKMLMDKDRAKFRFESLRSSYQPTCPLPTNNQGKAKGAYRYLNGIINMLAERTLGNVPIVYNPMEMTAFTRQNIPARSMSRRVDGAIPGVINPLAIWEIKEYYYTTTFGSKISDGIYATQLDGHELNEIHKTFGFNVRHIMFIDGHFTWWGSGRSYLCRLVDMLHMNLVDEVICGEEVFTEWPRVLEEIKILLQPKY